MEAKDKSTLNAGSFTAFMAGLLMLASAISYLFWPKEFFEGAGFDYFRMLLNRSGLYYFTSLSFLLSALFSICVVLTVTELIQYASRGLLRWIGILGIIGFSVIALNFAFNPAAEIQKSQAVLGQQGSYEGYGLFLISDQEGNILASPFAQGPAEKAGIQTGDMLLAVNGDSVRKGMKVQSVTDLLKSASGNSVTLSVKTSDQPPRNLTVEKDRVQFWDVSAQRAIVSSGITLLDPGYAIGFGLTGLWFIVIHWFALKKKIFPKVLCWLGMAAGIGFWLFVSQFFIQSALLTTIGKLLGMTLGPLWFLWTGFVLRKIKSKIKST